MKRTFSKWSEAKFASRLAAYAATAAVFGGGESSADAVGGNITLGNLSASSTFLNFTRGASNVLPFQAGPFAGSLRAKSFLVKGTTDGFIPTTRIYQTIKAGGLFATNIGTAHSFGLGKALQPKFTPTSSFFAFATFANPALAGSHVVHSADSDFGSTDNNGPLGIAGVKYFGFKANRNGTNYYGWLRISVTENGNHQLDTIAFAPNADGLIGAYMSAGDPDFGSFGAGSAAVPEPQPVVLAGLALLAFGAKGIREMRKRRAAEQI